MLQTATATDAPTNLIVTRVGNNVVELNWNPPDSRSTPVAAYEVFYTTSGSRTFQSGGTVPHPTTHIQLSGILVAGIAYEFFVVAYGAEEENLLPSEHSNTVEIVAGKRKKRILTQNSLIRFI